MNSNRARPADQALAVPVTPANAVDGPTGFDPSRMAERMGALERKAIMHREGGSEACMSWATAQRLYELGLTPRCARFLRLTPLGYAVRSAIAMEAAKPTRREAGSARKGDSAGRKGIAQRGPIPNAVHVITRRLGCYEYDETLVCAVMTETEAARFCSLAAEEFKAAVEAVPDTLDYPDDDAPDEEWTKWERRRKRAWGRFRRMLSCDPDAAPDGSWSSPDEPTYYSTCVPILAQGIEARRAETGNTDSVHEDKR